MKLSKALFVMSLATVAGSTLSAQATPISHLAVAKSTAITLTGTSGSINSKPAAILKWTAISNASYYIVTRDGAAYVVVKTAAYTDTQVAVGSTHTYALQAVVLSSLTLPSNTVTVTFPFPVTKPAAPTTLKATASWSTATSKPQIALAWTAPAGAGLTYNVYRNGSLLSAKLTSTAYTDTAVTSGTAYTYDVTAVDSAGEGPASTTASATAPSPPVTKPSAPTALSATGLWVANCPLCKMPMAHIILNWTAPAGAGLTYNVYRNGVLLTSKLTSTPYTDMSVAGGTTYTYAVTAVDSAGEGLASASASATAPFPPAAPRAPANVAVIGTWLPGSTDTVTWSPVPAATSYNLYRYNVLIASGLTSTVYVVPLADFMGDETYTITAVNASAEESLPSAPATAMGSNNPSKPPSWRPTFPSTPTHVVATPEWNDGAPRIKVTWYGDLIATFYNVYRDGVLVAPGLFDLVYYDQNVNPGETHSYTVTGADVNWMTIQQTAEAGPATATAPTAAPAPYNGPETITNITANDDSAIISFAAVPGALDYRCYTLANPNSVKYSGGGLSIEMNGLDPSTGADVVVQALDKLGPFQTMDGAIGPGAMNMGVTSTGVNGQGDPSDVPIVLAQSQAEHVTLTPRTLTGSQVFFDDFRGENPLTQDQTIDQTVVDANYNGGNDPNNPFVQSFSNDKWSILDYFGDMDDTKIFFMSNHFMDTVFDGGTPGSSTPMHNNNASIVMKPKAIADLSNGGVLHVTFEVDPHFDPRRWVDVVVMPAGDLFIHPGKVEGTGLWPSASGNEFRWEIQDEFHIAEVFLGGVENYLIDVSWNPGNERMGMAQRIRWDNVPLFNGTAQDLDKRHRFDLYLSTTHYRLMESGTIIKDHDFPTPLPFDKMQVYWVHEIYHTANDRPENVAYQPGIGQYWYNLRPWADERHWDNMGFEVLPSFP